MKTFTAHTGFEATENGAKVRYEKDDPCEIPDDLADAYAERGLGTVTEPRFPDESEAEEEGDET